MFVSSEECLRNQLLHRTRRTLSLFTAIFAASEYEERLRNMPCLLSWQDLLRCTQHAAGLAIYKKDDQAHRAAGFVFLR